MQDLYWIMLRWVEHNGTERNAKNVLVWSKRNRTGTILYCKEKKGTERGRKKYFALKPWLSNEQACSWLADSYLSLRGPKHKPSGGKLRDEAGAWLSAALYNLAPQKHLTRHTSQSTKALKRVCICTENGFLIRNSYWASRNPII